jgi:hypothetical protein
MECRSRSNDVMMMIVEAATVADDHDIFEFPLKLYTIVSPIQHMHACTSLPSNSIRAIDHRPRSPIMPCT